MPRSYLYKTGPLVWDKWAELLKHHPDCQLVAYILTGIRQGFCIGFNWEQRLQNATNNLPSQVPIVISEYLAREVSLNRMVMIPAGIWPSSTHISPLGVIPKKNVPSKWWIYLYPQTIASTMELIQKELTYPTLLWTTWPPWSCLKAKDHLWWKRTSKRHTGWSQFILKTSL